MPLSPDDTMFNAEYLMPDLGGYVNVYPPYEDSTMPRAYGVCWSTPQYADNVIAGHSRPALYRIHVIPKRKRHVD